MLLEVLQLREVALDWTEQDVQVLTEVPLIIAKDLKEMEL